MSTQFTHKLGLMTGISKRLAIGLTLFLTSVSASVFGQSLTLESSISMALANDPWLTASHHRQQALLEESVSSSSLPDPRVNVGAANLPIDSFDLSQEAMTQLAVGISQRFPRGESLSLSGQQKRDLAGEEPLLREDRMAAVAATVSGLWLEAYKAQESIRLIEEDHELFVQLVDAATSSYASAAGRLRQQDVIRAQLELTRIEDRLSVLRQQRDTTLEKLSEWMGRRFIGELSAKTPDLESTLSIPLARIREYNNPQSQYELFAAHPKLMAVEQRIVAMDTGVEIARQKFSPEWGISAQYGYRDDDPFGVHRSDMFSIGVSFDVPLFTSDRQDRDLSAARYRASAKRTEKQLVARRLVADLDTALTQLQRLDERLALYQGRLLPQMADQAEASLIAYNNDEGDFAEAVRARIAELNANVEALSIEIDRQQQLAKLRYLLTRHGDYAEPQSNPRNEGASS